MEGEFLPFFAILDGSPTDTFNSPYLVVFQYQHRMIALVSTQAESSILFVFSWTFHGSFLPKAKAEATAFVTTSGSWSISHESRPHTCALHWLIVKSSLQEDDGWLDTCSFLLSITLAIVSCFYYSQPWSVLVLFPLSEEMGVSSSCRGCWCLYLPLKCFFHKSCSKPCFHRQHQSQWNTPKIPLVSHLAIVSCSKCEHVLILANFMVAIHKTHPCIFLHYSCTLVWKRCMQGVDFVLTFTSISPLPCLYASWHALPQYILFSFLISESVCIVSSYYNSKLHSKMSMTHYIEAGLVLHN